MSADLANSIVSGACGMKVSIAVAASLLVLGALAGCGSKETKQPQGASFGKVLPGSASDAMPPYDTASSSPPLAPETYDAPADENGERPAATHSEASMGDVAPEAEPT
jgi:hypothetical protein